MTVGRAVALLALPVLWGCSEPAGTLVIELDALPSVTNQTRVSIGGYVSRTPPKETAIAVTVTGGIRSAGDTADVNGLFSADVSLALNATSTLTVTAQDAQGNVSQPVLVTIRQDAAGPSILTTTPLGDSASILATVEIEFTEPIVLELGGGLQVSHQGMIEPGATTVSADSTRLTFLSQYPFWENAIYQITFEGVADVAGNPAEATPGLCFVTVPSDAAHLTEPDPTDDLFVLGSPTLASPADIREVRLAAHSGGLFGVYRFSSPRGFGENDPDNAFTYLEIDIDQDPGTGFVTLKDTIFNTLPELASGIRAEYLVALDWFSEFADSAVVGQYTNPGSFEVLYVLWPDQCGAFQGFSLPTSLFDGDDGNFDYTVLAGNQEPAGLTLDPAPESLHFTAPFAGNFAAPRMLAAEAPERPVTILRHRRP